MDADSGTRAVFAATNFVSELVREAAWRCFKWPTVHIDTTSGVTISRLVKTDREKRPYVKDTVVNIYLEPCGSAPSAIYVKRWRWAPWCRGEMDYVISGHVPDKPK